MSRRARVRLHGVPILVDTLVSSAWYALCQEGNHPAGGIRRPIRERLPSQQPATALIQADTGLYGVSNAGATQGELNIE